MQTYLARYYHRERRDNLTDDAHIFFSSEVVQLLYLWLAKVNFTIVIIHRFCSNFWPLAYTNLVILFPLQADNKAIQSDQRKYWTKTTAKKSKVLFFDGGRLVTALIVKVKGNLLEWPKINLSTFKLVPILQANLLNQAVVQFGRQLISRLVLAKCNWKLKSKINFVNYYVMQQIQFGYANSSQNWLTLTRSFYSI